MIFATTLSVPAGTAATAKVEARLAIARGIIHLVEIAFLDGPENEVHVAVRRPGLHQLVPTTAGSIVGNNQTIPTVLHEEAFEPPWELVVEGWSPDADYVHEVAVRVHVLPQEVLAPPREELGILRRLQRTILGGR
ncbi:MAG: hypothetical protein ACE5IZ_10380 [Dehalococcoidia bacterium]